MVKPLSTSPYLFLSQARSQPWPKPLPPPLPFTNAATPGNGSQTHMIGLTREMVGLGSWTMMSLALMQHYHHEKYCIRIISFGWMYNYFCGRNCVQILEYFGFLFFCSWDWIFLFIVLVCSWSRWMWNRNLKIWMWNLWVYGLAGDWLVGFISCFPSIDGDWIWLLGLFLGFGKNMKNKLLCSYEKIMTSKIIKN